MAKKMTFINALNHLFKGRCKMIQSDPIPWGNCQGKPCGETVYLYTLTDIGNLCHENGNLNVRIDKTVHSTKWTPIYE